MKKDKRNVNIMFVKNGSGNRTCRLNIPVPWVDYLGITEDDKEVIIEIVGKRIIISRSKQGKDDSKKDIS